MEPTPGGPSTDAADIILVSCVKTKLAHSAPAKELYASDYFHKMRAYAEATGQPWFILSAERGVVHPDDHLDPDGQCLSDTTRGYRRNWGRRAADRLQELVGPLCEVSIEVHAGAGYTDFLVGPLQNSGARVCDELHGLAIGQRLAWYRRHRQAADPNVSDPLGKDR